MTFRSQKYGNIPNWRPDRCEPEVQYPKPLSYLLFINHAVCASVAEAADRQYSHVLLTAKVIPEVEKTTDLLSPFLTSSYTEKFSQPTYVLLQNGLGIETDLIKALKALKPTEEPKVIGASVFVGTRRLDKTNVEHSYFVSWLL